MITGACTSLRHLFANEAGESGILNAKGDLSNARSRRGTETAWPNSEKQLVSTTRRRAAAYSSSRPFRSSIAISLNSLDSNTSPHSLHLTYSESSSRETICTCGCLHWSGVTFCFLAGCDGWIGVICFPRYRLSGRVCILTRAIAGILGRSVQDVKCLLSWLVLPPR